MKRKKISVVMLTLLCSLLLLLALPLAASAESGEDAGEKALISPALSVLAAKDQMSVATLCGNDYYFSEDVFARVLNLSKVGAITICTLPDVTAGELMMGSERVQANQRIAAKDLQFLSFVAADAGQRQASFTFSPEDGGYEMVCNIHVLAEVNYSPTVSLASSELLSVCTHQNFVGYGTLSAYDPEGDEMVFEVVRAPEDGIVIITDRTCGEYVYLPRDGFVGKDTFCYIARDIYGNYSASAEVSVTVEKVATQIVFADMEGRREHNAALTVTEVGLMQGKQVGDVWNFDPDRQVSRGDFLVMAMQAMGVKSVPSVSNTGFFDDDLIPDDLKGYVAVAKDLGYIEGVADANGHISFAPDAVISRAEAAVIVSRMVGGGEDISVSLTVMPTFADGDEIPAWASEAIATLTAKGILRTVSGAISPNAIVTRADAASMLAAMIRLK